MADDSQDPGTLAPAPASDEPASGSGPPEPDESAPAAKAKKKSFGRELLTIVVAAAVLTLLVKAFVIQVCRIPSASMENTLQIGHRIGRAPRRRRRTIPVHLCSRCSFAPGRAVITHHCERIVPAARPTARTG